MSDENAQLSPVAARSLLEEARRISDRAHNAVRWPYITFLLALGLTTSMGTLGMAMTEGNAFGLVYVATLAAFFASMIFFLITTQGSLAFAWSKRWAIYIGAWLVPYLFAIGVMCFAHGSLPLAALASGLVFFVTFTAAIVEAKR